MLRQPRAPFQLAILAEISDADPRTVPLPLGR